MPTLRFVLKGQYITRIDSLAPVAKSRNYFYAHFDFQTPEWTGIKTALFTQGKQTKAAVLDDNDECLTRGNFGTQTGNVWEAYLYFVEIYGPRMRLMSGFLNQDTKTAMPQFRRPRVSMNRYCKS